MRPAMLALLLLASALVTSPQPTAAASPASGLQIVPSTATVTADQVVSFVVKASHQDGTITDVTKESTLSTNDPRGRISAATYAPGKIGSWLVQASYQALTTQATVVVSAGALRELEVNPNSQPETVSIGQKQDFNARGFDQHDNLLSNVSVTWRTTGSIGSINAQGVFTPTAIGTGKVIATSGNISNSVAVATIAAPVVPSNSTPDANVNRNTNTSTKNTNSAPSNTNVAVNGSTNVNSTSNTNSPETAGGTTSCTTPRLWIWVIILVAFLTGVALLYAFVPVSRIWPAVVAFAGAIILTLIQRKYGCQLYPWWAWIITLGTVALTIMGMRQTMPPSGTPPVTTRQ